MKPPFVVIGNPENRRVAFFRDAALRLGWPAPIEIAWIDAIEDDSRFDEIPSNSLVRVDSPGENFAVEKALIAIGSPEARREGAPAPTAEELRDLVFDQGRLRYLRAWYLGFRTVLRRIDRKLREQRLQAPTPYPEDIEVLFDKRLCHAACVQNGVPVPESLGPIDGYDALLERMRDVGWTRAFVKPAHGSSAAGVVAFERRRDALAATTTVELVESGGEIRLYNSLEVRRYTDEAAIRMLIDRLACETVHVEAWAPKAALDGRVFDLRILTVAGEPRHVVVRQSRGPLTNLHLGNRRGDAERLFDLMGDEAVERALSVAAGVARLFQRTLAIGVDVLVTPGFRQAFALEANAFGDLLPGVKHRGEDTYEAQVAAMLATAGVRR